MAFKTSESQSKTIEHTKPCVMCEDCTKNKLNLSPPLKLIPQNTSNKNQTADKFYRDDCIHRHFVFTKPFGHIFYFRVDTVNKVRKVGSSF